MQAARSVADSAIPAARSAFTCLALSARVAAALLCAIAGATAAASAQADVTGSGELQTAARAVGPFQGVALRGPMKLVLRQAAREAVEVRADANVLELVETRIVDRAGVPTLDIGLREGARFSTRHDITVTVDVTALSALSVLGSGDVTADALKADTLKVDATGSGDVKLERLDARELAVHVKGSGDVDAGGRVPNLRVAIEGSGDVDARRLEADDVRVSIAGSGDAKVQARRTLSVAIAGSGDVTYSGAASVTSTIAGSGSITKR